MPFIYAVSNGTTAYTTNGSANTESVHLAMRQATKGFWIQAFTAYGRAAGATSLSGIGFTSKRWTTAGSGGTTITPAPRAREAPAATTVCADSQTALTAGTVSGAIQLSFGCGVSSQGGWVARDPDSMIHVEAGSADEIDTYSISGSTSLSFHLSAEIME